MSRKAPAPVADVPDSFNEQPPMPPMPAEADHGEAPPVQTQPHLRAEDDPALLELRRLNAAAANRTPDGAPVSAALLEGRPLPAPAPAPIRYSTAPVEIFHATQLFPELLPRQSSEYPGMYLDAQGRPAQQRFRTGGMFSLRLLYVQNQLDRARVRQICAPLNADSDSWGVQPHEKVTKNVEVQFDFEDQRDAVLKRYGGAIFDPLRKNDEAPDQIPGLLGMRVA